MKLIQEPKAFGAPGIEPRWTRGTKDGVGTAYSVASRLWFSASAGVLNELYYPTIDRPQVRDLQYLVTDGESFFNDERRDTDTEVRYIDPRALGLEIVNRDREDRYRIVKRVICDPGRAALLVHTRFELLDPHGPDLRLFALLAPHLDVGGWGDSAYVLDHLGRRLLVAHGEDTWLALGASLPFSRTSVGYVGSSDGWTDLSRHLDLTWEFASAEAGNLGMTAEIDLDAVPSVPPDSARIDPGDDARGDAWEFTLSLAFGTSLHAAVTTLNQSLSHPFRERERAFCAGWGRACENMQALEDGSADGGALYRRSHSLLLAHEDKLYPGATVASLSIPWGDAKGDEEMGGYHLVWPRDMVNTAGGLLAAGRRSTPLRALVYLASSQRNDGGFHQNTWLDGQAYWTGIQLDETAFPILLAWRLHVLDALDTFDPWPMVRAAASFLVREGPATQQDRWEENAGYSPSTLAVHIAALICAAAFARLRGEPGTAEFFEDFADFLSCHVIPWTVTDQGTVHPDIPRHFIRINPVDPDQPRPDESPNSGYLVIANRPPGSQYRFRAPDIVDAGFIHLVRFGILPPGHDLVEESLEVVDHVLRVDTPCGPGWRRYNHDGYGQRPDGGPYDGWGVGRIWPLLTGERGHYELAAGRDPLPYIRAMERFATDTGLLPEQSWDADDIPSRGLEFGRPTGAATPLAWAHAEYIKLLRSARDDEIFDLVPAVRERYEANDRCREIEIWKPDRRPRTVPRGWLLRVMLPDRFRLSFARGGDETATLESADSKIGVHYVDLEVDLKQEGPLRFRFDEASGSELDAEEFRVDPVDALTI